MMVRITFRRAMIFSAIINITAALISVLIFFFTSNAPSNSPAFIFLYRFSIYKDGGREEFYFSFQKIFLKKSKNLIFRLLKPVYFQQTEVVFLRESQSVVSDVGLIHLKVCLIPAFRTPVPGLGFLNFGYFSFLAAGPTTRRNKPECPRGCYRDCIMKVSATA